MNKIYKVDTAMTLEFDGIEYLIEEIEVPNKEYLNIRCINLKFHNKKYSRRGVCQMTDKDIKHMGNYYSWCGLSDSENITSDSSKVTCDLCKEKIDLVKHKEEN